MTRFRVLRRLRPFAVRLAGDRRGATAIEYGLIAALIVITMIGAFSEMADTTTRMWTNVSDKVERAH